MNELLKNNNSILYLLPTLISENTHQSVLPVNYIEKIKKLSHFLVEDIRSARRFISSLKSDIIIDNLIFILLNKDTKKEDLEAYLTLCKQGISFGMLSEAGCPGIADPGALAVKLAHENNIQIIPIVGPSAIFLSLMASGFNGQNFEFHGYLPIEKEERRKTILKLEAESKQKNKTQIFIETPYRNNILLLDIIENCKNETYLCVSKDATGSKETIKSSKIKNWKNTKIDLTKTPTVFLIYAGV